MKTNNNLKKINITFSSIAKYFIKGIYSLYDKKFWIGVLLLFLVLYLGFIGNYYEKINNSDCLSYLIKPFTQNLDGNKATYAFLRAISYFGLASPGQEKINIFTVLSFLFAIILIFGGFVLFLFKKSLNTNIAKLLMKSDNIIFFGAGNINEEVLKNLTNNNKKNFHVIVIDKEEKNFEELSKKGYLFLNKKIDNELISKFDFEKTTDIIVALGNDRVNIDIVLKLIDKLKDVKTETKLIVHLNDREISDIFFEKLEKKKKEKGEILINLKTFSFYTEVVDDLFERYAIKLVPYEYAEFSSNKKEFKIAVIGNSDVSLEVIRRIFVNFIFPNEVKIRIFLIDEDGKEFYEKVKFETNYTTQKFPHIILESKNLNYNLLSDKTFWFQDDLIDIIIAFDDEDKNLETAIDLFEKIFIHKNNIQYPNVFFAMYKELLLSKYIDKNDENFKNFFTFGNMREILSVKNLLDDENFEMAKQIHYGYGAKYKKDEIILDKNKLNKKWFNSAKYPDKLSNIAQYEHIRYKLLSLGLYKLENNEKSKQNLLKYNQKILFSKLKYLGMIDENLIFKFSCEVEKSYDEKLNYQFDKQIVDEFFEKFKNSGGFYKLINTEHKRWIAYHYLNGWEYADKKDKLRKKHNCLVEINDFDDYSRKMTVIYDIYAYLYLPNYLAAGGYEIKP